MPAISTILGDEIKAAAESFFRTELAGIEIHFDRLPPLLDSSAFAYGNHIHVAANPTDAFSHRNLETLGHELTHVVQQRQGRVPANSTIHGVPANQDAALEAEAEEMGRRFAYGGPSLFPPLPLAPSHPPVLQRLLSIGGKVYSGLPTLSPIGNTILKLIQGAEEWLQWVTSNPSAHYRFANESELLLGIQGGLHGADLMLLRKSNVLLFPAKLEELSQEELKILLEVETAAAGNSVVDMQAKKALNSHGLLSQSELAVGLDFLQQAGVQSEPVFQAMTLSDQIALFTMVESADAATSLNTTIQQEAAKFAVNYSQSPREFVDYCQFYFSTVQETDPSQSGKRSRLAEAAVEAIRSSLYNLLWCPSVRDVPAPNEIPGIVQTWLTGGNRMGFARLSSALSQIGQNAGLQGATGTAAQQLIDQYMNAVQTSVVQQAPTSVTLSQDGRDHYYWYPSQSAVSQLCLAADGNLTLSNLRAQK